MLLVSHTIDLPQCGDDPSTLINLLHLDQQQDELFQRLVTAEEPDSSNDGSRQQRHRSYDGDMVFQSSNNIARAAPSLAGAVLRCAVLAAEDPNRRHRFCHIIDDVLEMTRDDNLDQIFGSQTRVEANHTAAVTAASAPKQ